MRVLLAGAAGFIGTAIHRALEADGHEVALVDALLPQAHRVPPRIPDLHRLDVREAGEWRSLLDHVDVVCHQAALVGAGTTVADLPANAGHNDLGTAALLAAMSTEACSGSSLPPRWSCTARAATHAQRMTQCGLVIGRSPRWKRATSTTAVRRAGRCWTGPSSKSRRRRTRAALTPPARSPRSTTPPRARQANASAVALRYHNVYGPGMPRDTPYSGVAAIFRSSLERGVPPQVFEDGAQMRDFVHVDDVARANVRALEAVSAQTPHRTRSSKQTKPQARGDLRPDHWAARPPRPGRSGRGTV